MKTRFLIPFLLLAIVGLPSKALGHAIETNYVLENSSNVKFTATFSSGEPLGNAKVNIYSPNNPDTPAIETTTNEKGEFTFVPDPKAQGDWEVSIKKEGHADYLTVPVNPKGVDINQISAAPHQNIPQGTLPLGAMVIASGIGTAVISARRQRSTHHFDA
ncbi:MAG: carboxypeptidase regulatory-like domain-containing protein [Acaryochloridaceae cyanobacterium CSU_5_19]|nr:carboxypeptidase regulatory-like domain-containing protein [Acaryochloridaceae cyanobacterium CSU_5_19]